MQTHVVTFNIPDQQKNEAIIIGADEKIKGLEIFMYNAYRLQGMPDAEKYQVRHLMHKQLQELNKLVEQAKDGLKEKNAEKIDKALEEAESVKKDVVSIISKSLPKLPDKDNFLQRYQVLKSSLKELDKKIKIHGITYDQDYEEAKKRLKEFRNYLNIFNPEKAIMKRNLIIFYKFESAINGLEFQISSAEFSINEYIAKKTKKENLNLDNVLKVLEEQITKFNDKISKINNAICQCRIPKTQENDFFENFYTPFIDNFYKVAKLYETINNDLNKAEKEKKLSILQNKIKLLGEHFVNLENKIAFDAIDRTKKQIKEIMEELKLIKSSLVHVSALWDRANLQLVFLNKLFKDQSETGEQEKCLLNGTLFHDVFEFIDSAQDKIAQIKGKPLPPNIETIILPETPKPIIIVGAPLSVVDPPKPAAAAPIVSTPISSPPKPAVAAPQPDPVHVAKAPELPKPVSDPVTIVPPVSPISTPEPGHVEDIDLLQKFTQILNDSIRSTFVPRIPRRQERAIRILLTALYDDGIDINPENLGLVEKFIQTAVNRLRENPDDDQQIHEIQNDFHGLINTLNPYIDENVFARLWHRFVDFLENIGILRGLETQELTQEFSKKPPIRERVEHFMKSTQPKFDDLPKTLFTTSATKTNLDAGMTFS